MKTSSLLLLFVCTLFQWCNAQQLKTNMHKVENHLKAELDYTDKALELIGKQANGEEISLGKIDTNGTLHFNLPEFDIKALYDNIPLQHYNFHQLFQIDSNCKDRNVFAETPFDDIYAEKRTGLFIKKYGIEVAVLEAITEKENETSSYYWFYIDRAINYTEECSKVSNITGNIYVSIKVDIEFNKGWNLIEEKKIAPSSDNTQPQKIQFSKISPSDKKVKWSLRQIQEDEKIETAKRLFNLTPISKNQFEKWVPNKLYDLAVTMKEHGNPPQGQKNKNNIHLIYTDKNKQKEIDLYVVDCAKRSDDMEMINFIYAMENQGKDEKDIKTYITKYNEETKIIELFYKVEDRILVNASGTNISEEEIWKYIKKLKVENLIK